MVSSLSLHDTPPCFLPSTIIIPIFSVHDGRKHCRVWYICHAGIRPRVTSPSHHSEHIHPHRLALSTAFPRLSSALSHSSTFLFTETNIFESDFSIPPLTNQQCLSLLESWATPPALRSPKPPSRPSRPLSRRNRIHTSSSPPRRPINPLRFAFTPPRSPGPHHCKLHITYPFTNGSLTFLNSYVPLYVGFLGWPFAAKEIIERTGALSRKA